MNVLAQTGIEKTMTISKHLLLVAVITLFHSTPTTTCSKILFISHVFSPSHFYVFEPVIKGLYGRNHNITIQSFFPLKDSDLEVDHLLLKPPIFAKSAKMKSVQHDMTKSSVSRLRDSVAPLAKVNCERLLTDETTKILLSRNEVFDIVLADGFLAECAVVLASTLGRHVILMYSSGYFPWLPTSSPEPLSYVPNDLEFLSSNMTFWQRLYNVYTTLGMRYVHKHHMVPRQQELLIKHLPQAPKIEVAMERVVFHITNGDPVMHSVRPSMPNVAHCGSLHCVDAKPLPKDLKDFVESSGSNGFIIFGMGSNIKAEHLTPEFHQAVISALGRLKQKVVWKFEGKVENLPLNVKIVHWMPQQDLLGHPKARLFITHAGLLSLQEAIYHGVPVITIPMFAEQPGNSARIKQLGIGEYISMLNITAEGLHKLITKVLNDKNYVDSIKKYSAILKDQPQKPVDKAVFWIEYIIRHSGAPHFRSLGDDLNFCQYFLLDVISVIGLAIFAFLVIIMYAFRLCIRKVTTQSISRNR